MKNWRRSIFGSKEDLAALQSALAETTDTSNVPQPATPKETATRIRSETHADKQLQATKDALKHLDCTRITDRIYACGQLWRHRTEVNSHRNNATQMAQWLMPSTTTSSGHLVRSFLIVNLASNLTYDTVPFNQQVMHVPAHARHSLPSLMTLFDLSRAMALFLSASTRNNDQESLKLLHSIIVMHCHNGLSRTGVAMACFLKFADVFPTANDAFEYFIERRANGDRSWVTCTQKRF